MQELNSVFTPRAIQYSCSLLWEQQEIIRVKCIYYTDKYVHSQMYTDIKMNIFLLIDAGLINAVWSKSILCNKIQCFGLEFSSEVEMLLIMLKTTDFNTDK